ncbi:MAG TPA: ribosomal protein S18-alanine N-acetyltransferase [Gammaproteobacteria bacterium]
MTAIRVTLAREGDVSTIAEMSRRLIEHGLPWSWDEERVRRALRHRESVVITARDRRRLAGFAVMEFYDEHAHLCLLAVHPGYRKQGVGRRLLEWLEATARTAGIFRINLELRVGNDGARQFYRKLGYREFGVRRAYYAGREDALRMTRDLTVVPASRT